MIGRTYIYKLKRKNTQNEQIIYGEIYCLKWKTYSLDNSQIYIM